MIQSIIKNILTIIFLCVGILVVVIVIENINSNFENSQKLEAQYTYDPNSEIFKATYQGDRSSVDYICNVGGDPDKIRGKYGMTFLHAAAAGGRSDIIKILRRCGADAEIKDVWRQTALHKAARNGHVESVLALLGFDPETYISDMDGYTASKLAKIELEKARSKGDGDMEKRYQRIISLLNSHH